MQNVEVIEYDHLTGETVERLLSQAELSDYEATVAVSLEYQAEQDAKAKARLSALAKLKKLGLTDKEIAAL